MIPWLLSTLALASGADWRLEDRMWLVDEPVAVDEGLSAWSVDSGYAFRILDGETPVGAILVGEGTWTVRFERPGDAVATVNRMVVLEGASLEELRPVVTESAPLELGVDRGMLLGLDAWQRLGPGLVELFQEDRALFTREDGMEWVLVQHDRRPEAARRIAEDVLRDRVEAWTAERFDPDSLLAVDAWDGRADVLLADFRTDHSWDRFAGHEQPGPAQPWLSYLREPSGAVDPAYGAKVFVGAPLAEGAPRHRVLTGARFPLDAEGRPRAPSRVDLAEATARHAFVPEASQKSVRSDVVADLRVRAVGEAQQTVWLDVPHVHQRAWDSEATLINAWKLEALTLADGTPLEAVPLPLTPDQREGRGSLRTYAVRLPEPLEPGQTAVIRVHWSDRHRYMRWLDVSMGDPRLGSRLFGLGANTSLEEAWPQVRTNREPEVRGEVVVGIPETLRHVALVSGDPLPTREQDGWTWFPHATRSPRPLVAIGDWRVHESKAGKDQPVVRIFLRNGLRGDDPGRAAWIRQQIALYEQVLPPYPEGTVSVVEWLLPTHRLGMLIAPDGLVPMAQTRELAFNLGAEFSVRNRFPELESVSAATGLQAHWWLARGPATPEDHRLVLALARAYGIASVEAVAGPEVSEAWMASLDLDARHQARFADPLGPASTSAGTLFAARTLPGRVGGEVVYEAVDRLLSGEFPASVDGLQQALEAVSGEDLQGFFDLAVRTGIGPRIGLTWAHDGTGLALELTSDVPFGEVDVPVRIHQGDQATDHVVRIVDGHALATLPLALRPDRIEVDPDQQQIFRSTTVRERTALAAVP